MKTRIAELPGIEHHIIQGEDVDAWSCSAVVGTIHGMPTVQEIID